LKYVYWYSGLNVKKDIKGSFLILVGCPGIGQWSDWFNQESSDKRV